MLSERRKRAIPARPNSEAAKDDGWCCNSDETFVMKAERRASIIQLRMFYNLKRG
jgi:hypothetical protein